MCCRRLAGLRGTWNSVRQGRRPFPQPSHTVGLPLQIPSEVPRVCAAYDAVCTAAGMYIHANINTCASENIHTCMHKVCAGCANLLYAHVAHGMCMCCTVHDLLTSTVLCIHALSVHAAFWVCVAMVLYRHTQCCYVCMWCQPKSQRWSESRS